EWPTRRPELLVEEAHQPCNPGRRLRRDRHAVPQPWRARACSRPVRAQRAHARRGLAIREKLLGPDHQAVAADAAALAAILDGQGKRDEAEVLIRRALTVFE